MLANVWRAVARGTARAARGNDRSAGHPESLTTPVTRSESGLTAESVFHDAALKYLDQQVATNDRLDARSAQNVQVGSTVVTIAFGLLRLNRAQIPDRAEYRLVGTLVGYGLVLILCLAASIFRTTEFRPDIPTVRGYMTSLTGDDLQRWVALEHMSSTVANKVMLRRKSWLVAAATLWLYGDGACLAVASLCTLP